MTSFMVLHCKGNHMLLEINESSLLIEIENFIQNCLVVSRQPRSFYLEFSQLLKNFEQIYDLDYCYSGLIECFCYFLYEYEIELYSAYQLEGYLKEKPFKQWQQYFKSAKKKYDYEMRQHRYSERLNVQKLESRLDELVEDYSALLVVRVDLNYRTQVTIQQVSDDLNTFRREYDQTEYSEDTLLLVWALEQGEVRGGYHCHVALILNGRKRSAAWHISKAIGTLWEKVTDHQGGYFNCHRKEYIEQYDRRGSTGVGMVFSQLSHQVQNMYQVMAYLARPEKAQYLRVKTSAKMRSFGMTQAKPKITRRNRCRA